jgi:hypothetical protein
MLIQQKFFLSPILGHVYMRKRTLYVDVHTSKTVTDAYARLGSSDLMERLYLTTGMRLLVRRRIIL